MAPATSAARTEPAKAEPPLPADAPEAASFGDPPKPEAVAPVETRIIPEVVPGSSPSVPASNVDPASAPVEPDGPVAATGWGASPHENADTTGSIRAEPNRDPAAVKDAANSAESDRSAVDPAAIGQAARARTVARPKPRHTAARRERHHPRSPAAAQPATQIPALPTFQTYNGFYPFTTYPPTRGR